MSAVNQVQSLITCAEYTFFIFKRDYKIMFKQIVAVF